MNVIGTFDAWLFWISQNTPICRCSMRFCKKKVLSLYCMNKISHVSKERGMCLSKYLSMPAGIWSLWRSAGFVHALLGLYIHVIKSWIHLGLSLTLPIQERLHLFLNLRFSCVPWTEQSEFFPLFFPFYLSAMSQIFYLPKPSDTWPHACFLLFPLAFLQRPFKKSYFLELIDPGHMTLESPEDKDTTF